MHGTDLARLPATVLRRMLVRGETDPRAILEATLNRIASRDALIQAWAHLTTPDAPLGSSNGSLSGIPIGIKDIIDTRDMPTTYGSKRYANHQPSADATVVGRIKSSGGMIVGKTHTTEFASVFSPAATTNPWDRRRTPGGSSSGSAAAVADFMVPIAVGTQTLGSVLRPASFCGVFGYKPTFGAVGIEGVKPVSPSLDTIGFFARSVSDLSLVAAAAITGWLPEEPPTSKRPFRVALVRTNLWHRAERASQAAVQVTAGLLRDAGAYVAEPVLPAAFGSLVEACVTVFEYEARTSLEGDCDGAGPGVAEVVERGRRISAQAYLDAISIAQQQRAALATGLGDFDFILTPCVIGEAPSRRTTGDPLFLGNWTLLGWPTVSVPALLTDRKLPVGVQLVGLPNTDARLLRAAQWVGECLSSSGAH
jgi:Asp-tRNA(Asn)/Glu-tRNA(Gln) amidotransferase A subunit family amidase